MTSIPAFVVLVSSPAHSKKWYSLIPAKISSRTFGNPFVDFGNPKMVFEGKKVSERFGNPLRVSNSNKLGN
jgi:hypothetical protein